MIYFFCLPGLISRDTQHFFGVIFSPSAGIVLLFDLRNTEALESERMKKTEDRLSNQAD